MAGHFRDHQNATGETQMNIRHMNNMVLSAELDKDISVVMRKRLIEGYSMDVSLLNQCYNNNKTYCNWVFSGICYLLLFSMKKIFKL
jgi:hypothetical protein